eukprot:GHVO01011029.1.p1 GENE.GHVO01011029.1~~GHVO01011029.1.p1  ORF type:complete len:118 (+),score=16.25 GHVO01011029.1:85-438(+)
MPYQTSCTKPRNSKHWSNGERAPDPTVHVLLLHPSHNVPWGCKTRWARWMGPVDPQSLTSGAPIHKDVAAPPPTAHQTTHRYQQTISNFDKSPLTTDTLANTEDRQRSLPDTWATSS